ncbi:hypothetical protein [cyanobacterium endosymbiont of Rhopalodia gibberula]
MYGSDDINAISGESGKNFLVGGNGNNDINGSADHRLFRR